MDSGNSGSLQSSSDADDEYDSRAAVDSVSAFFAGGSVSIPPTQASPLPPPPVAAGFDPFSNFFQLHQNPNIALPGSGSSPRSDPNNRDAINPFLSTSPAFTLPELPPPVPPRSQNNQTVARNPRKRTRASRRAPTTVLTTDTTNFRAMVQEFTGIPSPPFNNSPFTRTRFDPFGSRFTSMDGGGGAQSQPQPPSYLRRPFAQKTPLPFLPSSSSLLGSPAAAMAASSSNNPSTASSLPIPQINHQFPISKASSNPFINLNPDPIFTSILQPNPKFPIPSTSPPIETKSFEIFPSNDDQFPHLGHGNQPPGGLPNLLPSDHNNAARWSNNPDNNSAASMNGGFSFIRTSTEENDVGRGSDAAAAAGMVESSWICSSSE